MDTAKKYLAAVVVGVVLALAPTLYFDLLFLHRARVFAELQEQQQRQQQQQQSPQQVSPGKVVPGTTTTTPPETTQKK